MACQITNNSNLDTSGFEDTMQQLVSFSQDRFGFENPPALFLNSDPSNASDPLGKTAYYDPENKEIHIYVDERHPKDIMRSISHELIHHVQNLRGDLSGNHYHGEGYAQKDQHMREMEREAYEQGNLCFRDFEDKLKLDKTTYNEWRTNKMSLKEWKNNELFTLLSSKWGFGKNTITEGAKPFDDGDDKDEKCDYVDCDNEKKLGESNCGDHDEKLEEGEFEPLQYAENLRNEIHKLRAAGEIKAADEKQKELNRHMKSFQISLEEAMFKGKFPDTPMGRDIKQRINRNFERSKERNLMILVKDIEQMYNHGASEEQVREQYGHMDNFEQAHDEAMGLSEGGMKDLHSKIENMLDTKDPETKKLYSVEKIVADLGVSKKDVDGVKQDMTTAKTELKEAMRKRFARLIK